MQDLHSVEISDERLRLHQHDLKCPRCDSLNTKFCYYNNYNLCQPRHFCKGCRRYWTKGGALRNVPVGAGIRKPKRSVKLKSKTSVSSSDAADAEHKSMNSENLSSNISSHKANMTSANMKATTTEMNKMDVSRSSSPNSTPARLLNFNEPSTRIFNFSRSSSEVMAIDPLWMNQPQQQNQLQWTETDQMAEIDYTRLESRRSNGGVAGDGDGQLSASQGLFDQSYWTQNHWNADDHDHHLTQGRNTIGAM